MSEEKELVAIIPKNEYKEDLEAEVSFQVARINAGNPFRVTRKYSPVITPEFKPSERREQRDWEMAEIKKCIEGYGELSGRAYYFFNHVLIKHKSRGKIRPDFRATQAHFFNTLDRIIKTPGLGLVSVKRRQIGASWMFSADNVYDCQFNLDFDIGMNSKSETDSRNLFLKHKYIHRNQSNFLKSFVSIDRRDAMIFGEYDKKTEKYKGNQSSIISVAPTVAGHAGNQYRKLVCDEVGETSDFVQLFGNAEDCLMQDGIRVGSPFLFGTAGDMGRTGQGLMEFWKNHKIYNLEQFGLWGYNCLITDDWGNDDILESVRYIIYERKRRESASKYIYNKFIQKYPLNEADAFLDASGGGVGDPILLGKQRLYLFDNPPQKVTGWMRQSANPSKPDFVPDPNGELIIYEKPDPNRANGYIFCVDPAEDDHIERSKDNSDLATAGIAKPYGLEPPKLVFEYCHRPKKLHDYYSQLAMVLQWYNNTQLHIEMNKGGWRMLDWFELNYPHIVALTPAASNSARGGVMMKKGVKKTTDITLQMQGLGNAYVENYSNFIPSIRLIDQFGVFGDKGRDDDMAVAFLWTLVVLQGDRILAKNIAEAISGNPTVNYVKQNGVIRLVTGNQQPEPVRHKSALFRNL
jgi:hypothetical protein